MDFVPKRVVFFSWTYSHRFINFRREIIRRLCLLSSLEFSEAKKIASNKHLEQILEIEEDILKL